MQLTHYPVIRIIILVIHCQHKTVKTQGNESFRAYIRAQRLAVCYITLTRNYAEHGLKRTYLVNL